MRILLALVAIFNVLDALGIFIKILATKSEVSILNKIGSGFDAILWPASIAILAIGMRRLILPYNNKAP